MKAEERKKTIGTNRNVILLQFSDEIQQRRMKTRREPGMNKTEEIPTQFRSLSGWKLFKYTDDETQTKTKHCCCCCYFPGD